MLRFRIPQSRLEEMLVTLGERHASALLCEAGVSRCEGETTYVFHEVVGRNNVENLSPVGTGMFPIVVRTLEASEDLGAFAGNIRKLVRGAGIGFMPSGDTVKAFYCMGGGNDDKPAVLSMPGASMRALSMNPVPVGGSAGAAPAAATPAPAALDVSWQRRVERLAGGIAAGDVDEGLDMISRARRMRVVVLGAGGAGSWLALRLAQCGVGAEGGLTVADLDVVEEANLDRMLVSHLAVTYPKAEAVARHINSMVSDANARWLNASLSDESVVNAVRRADAVFSGVDDDAMRFGLAALASRYHVLHVDVAGGSTWVAPGKALTGGEMRVFVPGSDGCLACMGRYDGQAVLASLERTREEEVKRRAKADWRTQRPGSSVDVLMPVIGEALQAFWGVVRGDITESFWLHYEKDVRCRPVWSEWSSKRLHRECPNCGHDAGLGDLALS